MAIAVVNAMLNIRKIESEKMSNSVGKRACEKAIEKGLGFFLTKYKKSMPEN